MRRGSVEAIVPVVFLAIAVFVLMIVATACATQIDVDRTVTSSILEPSNKGIATNAFLLHTPTSSSSSAANLLSAYIYTNDAGAKGHLENGLREMFQDKRVEVVIDENRILSNGIDKRSNEFNLVTKNVILPDGKIAPVNVRFYR